MSQEKIEPILHSFPLEELGDPVAVIASHLDKTDESQERKSMRALQFPNFRTNLIQTNRILTRLAQFAAEGKVEQVAKLVTIRPDLRLQVLFTLAGLGAQEQMETILRQYPEDLLVYRPLRDISGAQFESISLFQHCIWTKDVRYMANMMLDCLPKNEKGEQIRIELVRQFEELKAKGVAYQLKGVKHENERHFNLQPLISALRTYVDNYNHWTEELREQHWCTVVGFAQTLIPAHIRHHYCDPEVAFWNNPGFQSPKLTRSLEIYNWFLGQSQSWAEGLVGLGSDLGIYAVACTARAPRAGPLVGRSNLTALTALDKVRTEVDLPALIERLQTPIQNLDDDLGLQGMKF